MAGYTAPVMTPGPVEYRRKYSLAILVILIIFCWPAAIIYYFTRDKVPVQELQTYAVPIAQPVYAVPAYGQPQVAQAAPMGGAPNCKGCGRTTTFLPQYGRYYCYGCAQYA